MEKKPLPLNESVHTLCSRYPELMDILVEIGFPDIVKPGMLNTVGRLMTLPKGAMLKKLDLEQIKELLRAKGFDPVESIKP